LFSLVADGTTLLPSALDKYARKAESIAAFVTNIQTHMHNEQTAERSYSRVLAV
jgi:hypothetical protein